MIIVPPLPFRRRRKAGPPATLQLVSAVYDDTAPMLFLTFDRAVDASAMVVAAVSVNDGSINNGVYVGAGAPGIESPTTISIVLERLADTPVGPATLSASTLTGLKAIDDGGTWAGANELGLPFDA